MEIYLKINPNRPCAVSVLTACPFDCEGLRLYKVPVCTMQLEWSFVGCVCVGGKVADLPLTSVGPGIHA